MDPELEYPFPEAPEYGRIIEISDTVRWIRMPLPYALDHINLWLIADGDGWTLIDTGFSTSKVRGMWEEIFANDLDGKPINRLIVTHFHPDHSAEVPAILWPRGGDLRVAGPSGSPGFPSLDDYLSGLFGPEGVFRVLNSRAKFDPITVDVKAAAPTEVLAKGSLLVTAQGVPHGNVPALGYRVEVGDASIVFSSDQNGSDPAFTEFSKDVDVLVVHFAGSEEARGGQARNLHAKPSVWGQIATDAKVKELVLSHISSNQDFDANLKHLKSRYSGPVTVAKDLMCVAVE